MSELLNQIKKDQLQARKDKDKLKSSVLTTVLGTAAPSGNDVVTDETVKDVLQKHAKNIKEKTLPAFEERGLDCSEHYKELEIIESYLPKKFTKEELDTMVKEFIKENGFSSKNDMGQVMKHFNTNYSGLYEGKVLKQIVLSNLE